MVDLDWMLTPGSQHGAYLLGFASAKELEQVLGDPLASGRLMKEKIILPDIF